MILQCVEASEQYITMNECQTTSFHDSNCFGRETDYMDSESKEIYVLNDSSRDIGFPPSEAKGRVECWSAKVMDEFPLNNDNVMVNSQKNAGQNAPSHWEKDEDSEQKRCEEQECLMTVEECNTHNKSGLNNSSFSPSFQIAVDGHIVDCNLPELEVCYKEINHLIVKDICIDEGRHEHRILIESVTNDMSDIIETSSNINDPSADQSESKEQVICEETGVTTATHSLEDGSLMDIKLPILDLDGQSSIVSLPNPIDGEVKRVKQLLNQISNRSEVSEEDACAGGSLDNTKVKSESSSSNLDSPVQFIAGITIGTIVCMMDGNSDGSSIAMVHQQSNNKDRDGKSAHLSGPQNDSQHEHWNLDNASFVSQLENDKGETSFSAASLIAYSGSITASGNISNRSDSSATSTRSFAFPILQSEWNSSPVRMAKADRKHRCWLSVPRCCGF